MDAIFADRVKKVPRSFIREILKVSLDPTMISFAGGMPNPAFFPIEELAAATSKVFSQAGAVVLQYSNSEGNVRLREHIAARYLKEQGITVPVDDILITSGSQQGLDLLGKILLNKGDATLIEEPGYLGAIQALSMYRPEFEPVPLLSSGVDCEALAASAARSGAKMFYCVPSFQNPSGLSYEEQVVEKAAEIAKKHNFLVVEDNPYCELRFRGTPVSSFYKYIPELTVLLGSFSKIVSPGFRIGWIVAPPKIMGKLLVAKQATDLHTSNFTQNILAQYLDDNDLDQHIAKIRECYGHNCEKMESVLAEIFPPEVTFTAPDGGMFLWGELPEGMNSMDLFDYCAKEKAVFVPGEPFYTNDNPTRSFRLSFSCVDDDTIVEGIQRLKKGYDAYKATL